ncbi:hypothetical protein [Xylophilus sp.]|uniref:hypothetical protein n=1 Tax=Xylophilus sp. TaxID=2653893 RepID=UPI002D7FCB0A|nr:hypothetical protein [Xylophilus sp.]
MALIASPSASQGSSNGSGRGAAISSSSRAASKTGAAAGGRIGREADASETELGSDALWKLFDRTYLRPVGRDGADGGALRIDSQGVERSATDPQGRAFAWVDMAAPGRPGTRFGAGFHAGAGAGRARRRRTLEPACRRHGLIPQALDRAQ